MEGGLILVLLALKIEDKLLFFPGYLLQDKGLRAPSENLADIHFPLPGPTPDPCNQKRCAD